MKIKYFITILLPLFFTLQSEGSNKLDQEKINQCLRNSVSTTYRGKNILTHKIPTSLTASVPVEFIISDPKTEIIFGINVYGHATLHVNEIIFNSNVLWFPSTYTQSSKTGYGAIFKLSELKPTQVSQLEETLKQQASHSFHGGVSCIQKNCALLDQVGIHSNFTLFESFNALKIMDHIVLNGFTRSDGSTIKMQIYEFGPELEKIRNKVEKNQIQVIENTKKNIIFFILTGGGITGTGIVGYYIVTQE